MELIQAVESLKEQYPSGERRGMVISGCEGGDGLAVPG
jgi:hypothetical protein